MNREPRKPFAKKSLGQNFLVDQNYIRKIIDAVDPLPEDTIIEIGPGRGAITEKLTESGAAVIAIELDRQLVPELRNKFSTAPNFRIFEADATRINFADLVNPRSKIQDPNSKVVANLPYYISTAILRHLASQRENFHTLVLMFQKEVVDRITAPPGSSERGYLTVITEAAFSVERLFDVPPAAFRPAPKVTSTVARFTPKASLNINEELFERLVSTAFAQKRKTILNNLRSSFPDASKIIERSGIGPKTRAESLSMDDWSRLVGVLEETGCC